MSIRILLADDHEIVRDGLRMLLERAGFQVEVEAADGLTAVRRAGEIQVDVAVLDIGLPMLNGLETAREIQKISPKTKIVFLTMHNDRQYLLKALRLGAKGYVMKSHASEQLVQAIRGAVRGKTYLSPDLSASVLEGLQSNTAEDADPLTPRERQVLQLVAEGRTTKQVASILGISAKTAETHRSRSMEKLNIHETAGLVRYAIRRGLVEP